MPKIQNSAKSALSSNPITDQAGAKHICILMDESGSMSGLEESVITGCNEFIHAFKDDDDAKIWLAWFDASPGEPRTRFKVKGEAAKDVSPLTAADYEPRGATPLNDSISDVVTTLGAVAGEDEVVFMAIITDGAENASETSTESIKELLTQREAAGWGIVFLGANQDAQATAAEFGITKPGRAFNFAADTVRVEYAMKNVATLAKSRAGAAVGLEGLVEYDDAAKKMFDENDGRIDSDLTPGA